MFPNTTLHQIKYNQHINYIRKIKKIKKALSNILLNKNEFGYLQYQSNITKIKCDISFIHRALKKIPKLSDIDLYLIHGLI